MIRTQPQLNVADFTNVACGTTTLGEPPSSSNIPDGSPGWPVRSGRVQFINPELMLWPVIPLIAYMSEYFTLEAGDIILTGTPEGVGELKTGDRFSVSLSQKGKEVFTTKTSVQ